MNRLPRIAASLCVTTALALVLAAPAGAHTFCVPSFHAACPNNGTNVAQADLETAMQANANDGIADTIRIDAGVQTNTDTFTAQGADALEIVGAGPGTTAAATRLTTSSSSNIILVNLASATRAVTMRDLTIVIPATIPANQGVGLQARQDTVTNVDFESATVNHQLGINFVDGGTYQDGAMYGVSGGSIGTGVSTVIGTSGPLELLRLQFSQVVNGVSADEPTAGLVTLRRSRIDAPVQTGAVASNGGTLAVENSVITDPGVVGVGAISQTAGGASATVRHTTIVRVAGTITANPLHAEVDNAAGNGNATMTATGMIIRGFTDSYFRLAPVSGTIGNANLTLSHSNFLASGTNTGDGTLTLTPGNINADPLFAGATNFHLLAGSPSIDTADPAPAFSLTDDFDGLPRPCDGNGDGVARNDMGAFEFQPSPCVPQPPSMTPLTTPQTPPKKVCKKPKKKKKKKNRAAAAKKKKKRKKC